jgi:hypothetical protein
MNGLVHRNKRAFYSIGAVHSIKTRRAATLKRLPLLAQ